MEKASRELNREELRARFGAAAIELVEEVLAELGENYGRYGLRSGDPCEDARWDGWYAGYRAAEGVVVAVLRGAGFPIELVPESDDDDQADGDGDDDDDEPREG